VLGLASTFCSGPSPSPDSTKLPKDLTTAPLPKNLSPFTIIGPIQSFTLDDPTDVLTSAKMVVNGLTVVLPRNSFVVVPSGEFITPAQMFARAPMPWGPTQSGLALADSPRPLQAFEVQLDGNRVNDTYIAGLVHVAQEFLQESAGIINFIDYDRGALWVGGPMGMKAGGRVKINDPDGRFGRAGTQDDRFGVDPDNPTVHATTGYPMCLARTNPAVTPDPECPETNRPLDPMTGAFLSNFVMAHPTATVKTDPAKQAPFEKGDYIVYNGNVASDDLGTYVAAHSIDDNLGIFTEPGTTPTYLSLEASLIGTGGIPIPGVEQEATIRFKMEGFTTDPSAQVDMFMIDVAPCSGNENARLVATANPLDQPLFGRFRFIVDALNIAPLAREVQFRTRNGLTNDVANGLVAGQYRFPVDEWIFAENFVLGGPTVPLNFQDMPFLTHGYGPLGGTGPVVGQLSPWPGDPVPAPAVCDGTNALPVADAGPDQVATTGRTVRLDGTKSFDPDFTPLDFAWVQTAGPTVTLSDDTAGAPTFTAPTVAMGGAPLHLTFQLTVTEQGGTASASDTVDVTVNPAGDTVTITTATFSLRRSTLTVTATSTDPTGTAILTLSGFGVMTNGGGGTYTFVAIGQVNPGEVTVNSSLGGSATLPVTVIR